MSVSHRHQRVYLVWPYGLLLECKAECECPLCEAKGTLMQPQTERFRLMSPHAVNTFVSDLVHMAQAMERLPQVERELVEAKDQVEIKENYIQHLQMRSIDAANEISDLRTQVKAMEGQRDDAELRFLLADDRAQHAIKALRDVAGSLGVTISVIDPPKEEAKPEPVTTLPVDDMHDWNQAWAQSADPLPIQPTAEPTVTQGGGEHSPTSDTVGPTADTLGSSSAQSPTVSSDNATTADVSTSLTEPVSVQPHPTIPSADPVPLPSGVSSNEGGTVPGVSVPVDPIASPITTTEGGGTNAASDPEPLPRYTWAWYQWRDRTIEDRVKDGLPAVSQASHYS